MAAAPIDPLLTNAAVYLGATVVAVPLFKRAGLGSILGYLVVGALIGPFGFGLVTGGDVADVRHIAEYGVVLLLFVIGLELRPARLWRMRSEIFGLGLLQVGLTGAAVGLVLAWFGFSPGAAAATGLGLALSSTAFGVQILRDRGALKSPYGDRTFSILLFQDLAVVPLLALTSFLSAGPEAQAMGWDDAAVALTALGGLALVGHYGLGRAFRLIAMAGADEAFTAAALLVVILAALAMQWAGLSMALGAFLAGVLLAETEFRHQLETDIAPFRTLFLGLFFAGVGMSVDWGLALGRLDIVLGGALALFAVKMAGLYVLARLAHSPHADALRIGATIGQAGEFAFVVFSLAAQGGLIDLRVEALLTATVGVSMALTPLAILAVERFLSRQPAGEAATTDLDGMRRAGQGSVIVAGFGRVGQVIARIMRMRGYAVTLIDKSPRRIRMARSFGSQVWFGDATRLDVMDAAGAGAAKAIFLCIDDREGAKKAVESLKERFPKARVFISTYDRFSELDLRDVGADFVMRETLEGSVALARIALKELGDGEVIDELIADFRRRDEELLRLQIEYGAVEGAAKLRAKYRLEAS